MMHSVLKTITIVLLPLFLTGCNKVKFEPAGILEPQKTFSLKITEPSGLDFTNGKLWIVGDRKNTVYQTDTEGKVEHTFKIKEADTEGIAVINDSLLAVVKEKSRQVIIVDLEGNEISRASFEVKGDKNSGLEGIAYNPSNEHFYLINEKDPVLLIEADKNLNEISRREIKNVRDLSGASYSRKENCLWLLSDEDRKIIKASLEGEFISGYEIDVVQPEGIAVDDDNNLVYVVSDREAKLYVYKIE